MPNRSAGNESAAVLQGRCQETRSPGWLHCALRKFGWVCESCSGLVDLVVGVGHHRGSRHRLTSPGERFVGLVAEDIAQIGDGGGELGVRCRGEGAEGEASDGGRRFIASEPGEKGSEDTSGKRIMVVLPASWKFRTASAT